MRSVFRLVEFTEDYNGYIMTHDVFMYVFDGLLMLIAMVDMIVYLPTEYLGHGKAGTRQDNISMDRGGCGCCSIEFGTILGLLLVRKFRIQLFFLW